MENSHSAENMKYVSFYGGKNPISKAMTKININPRLNFLQANLNYKACFFKKSRHSAGCVYMNRRDEQGNMNCLIHLSLWSLSLFWFLLHHSTLHHGFACLACWENLSFWGACVSDHLLICSECGREGFWIAKLGMRGRREEGEKDSGGR